MNVDAFSLADDEVRVWSFALDLAPAEAVRCAATLSADERGRAARFHFERDRAHFIAARGTLRALLGAGLGRAPGELRFAAGPHGKPRLTGEAGGGGWCFNLSHAQGRALLAVARGREVGVDLEWIRDEVDCAGIVASHFSPAEQAEWAALPEGSRRAAFFHGWVRKEAYVKARGEGLAREPAAYTVELAPDAPGRLVADRLAPDAPSQWTLRSLAAPAGFAAALAHAGPACTVRLS